MLFLYCYSDHRDLPVLTHSFPTRRSSDLPTISDLNAHMGYLLRVASNAVSHEFARKIADEDVTVAEWSLMRVLYDADALAPTALADKMGMTKEIGRAHV